MGVREIMSLIKRRYTISSIKDCSYKSIYNSLENISKEKNEIQGKLEKHRRKAQKSLIKLEQHETSILTKLIEKRTSDFESQKSENELERSEVISEIQKLQSSLDSMVAQHREEE